jgi:hypothetical protein
MHLKVASLWLEPLYNGSSSDVFNHYGLTGSGIAQQVVGALRK